MSYDLVPYGLSITVEHDVVRWVRRTWRERLFSWPWRPWITHKIRDTFRLFPDVCARVEREMRNGREFEGFREWPS